MIEKRRSDVLTPFERFYVISVSRKLLLKSGIVKFMIFVAFFYCESKCVSTDVTASTYDRKTATRHFEIIYDILGSFGLAQSFLKDLNGPIGRNGNRGVSNADLKDF